MDAIAFNEAVYAAIAKLAPIEGLAVGNPEDRSTWRIDFRKEATDEQRKAAAELLATFTPTEPVAAISKRQALLFLLQLGKTEADVEAAINAIADATAREAARIEWRYPSGLMHEDHPLMIALAPAVGLKVGDLPDAFRAAALL